jgi:hypothetical protein
MMTPIQYNKVDPRLPNTGPGPVGGDPVDTPEPTRFPSHGRGEKSRARPPPACAGAHAVTGSLSIVRALTLLLRERSGGVQANHETSRSASSTGSSRRLCCSGRLSPVSGEPPYDRRDARRSRPNQRRRRAGSRRSRPEVAAVSVVDHDRIAGCRGACEGGSQARPRSRRCCIDQERHSCVRRVVLAQGGRSQHAVGGVAGADSPSGCRIGRGRALGAPRFGWAGTPAVCCRCMARGSLGSG